MDAANTVTVNVGALSTALASALQQAAGPSSSPASTSGGTDSPQQLLGRPRHDANVAEIFELRRLNYTWTKIASLLQISRSTLYRRLEEAGISDSSYTPISDDELDSKISAIKVDHPHDGEVLIQGHLVSMGIKVTRRELRASIHRIDHDGVSERQTHVIRRRVYNVPHPNAVWHIDGHHKLIRWRFVIHAGVDGFSRTIVFAKCSDNNRAPTVLQLFMDSVVQFGLPNKVRSDRGGENVGVWRYMIAAHNEDYASVITGSSVHNERIERLWRDIHRCVAVTFADIFRSLEGDGTLDPNNEVDLFCLHHVFLPLINKSLYEFKESWNNHCLSSERSRTPYQLFREGLSHAITDVGYDSGTVDLGSNTDVSHMTTEHVGVPRIAFIPCTVLSQDICRMSTAQSRVDGKSLYNQVIQRAGVHLSAGCGQCTEI